MRGKEGSREIKCEKKLSNKKYNSNSSSKCLVCLGFGRRQPEAICGKRIYLMNGEFDEGDDSVDRVGDFWQQISVLDQFLDANLANNV